MIRRKFDIAVERMIIGVPTEVAMLRLVRALEALLALCDTRMEEQFLEWVERLADPERKA